MQPEGFVKERDLRLRRYVPVVSFAAEAADVIEGTVSLGLFEKRDLVKVLEEGGSALEAFVAFVDVGESATWLPTVLLQVIDASTGLPVETTAFTLTVTSGTADSGDGTGSVVALVDASGKIVFDLADVAGGSGAQLQVIATVLNGGSTGVGIANFD